MSEAADFEGLLRQALSPVEPPEHLANRLEQTLLSITEMAAEELEAWELSAMRDPRNWVRPLAAVMFGTGAGAALVLLRVRRRTAQTGLRRAGARAEGLLEDLQTRTRRLPRLR